MKVGVRPRFLITVCMAMGLALAARATSPVALPDADASAAERLCAFATADVLRAAAEQGLEAQVVCRPWRDTSYASHAAPVSVQANERPVMRSGPIAWPIRIATTAQTSRRYAVPLTLNLRSAQWIAARELNPGEAISSGDLVKALWTWPTGITPQFASLMPPNGRLVRRVRRGEAVLVGDIGQESARLRNDPVQIVLVDGAMEVRMPGRLLAPARIGQLAKVQPAGRDDVLTGTLQSDMTVWTHP